jgi:hypothetical protein
MRNLVFGAIAAVWGTAVVVNGLLINQPEGSGSYQSGQVMGIVIGGVLAVFGVFTVVKALRAR